MKIIERGNLFQSDREYLSQCTILKLSSLKVRYQTFIPSLRWAVKQEWPLPPTVFNGTLEILISTVRQYREVKNVRIEIHDIKSINSNGRIVR